MESKADVSVLERGVEIPNGAEVSKYIRPGEILVFGHRNQDGTGVWLLLRSETPLGARKA